MRFLNLLLCLHEIVTLVVTWYRVWYWHSWTFWHEWISEYIRIQICTQINIWIFLYLVLRLMNECPNIFVKEKLIQTNVQIRIRDQYIWIFKYLNIFVTLWHGTILSHCNGLWLQPRPHGAMGVHGRTHPPFTLHRRYVGKTANITLTFTLITVGHWPCLSPRGWPIGRGVHL